MKSILYSLVAALVISAGGSSAFAQLSPPLSPWLRMDDRPRSSLGNYLGTVQPQQGLMKSSASQTSQIQAQQRALQSMLQAPSSSGSGTRATGASNLANTTPIAPTGGALAMRDVLAPPREIPRVQNPAGFDQYLHYYPPYSMTRRPVPNFSTTGYSTVGRRR
jgi:hypothetical protein